MLILTFTAIGLGLAKLKSASPLKRLLLCSTLAPLTSSLTRLPTTLNGLSPQRISTSNSISPMALSMWLVICIPTRSPSVVSRLPMSPSVMAMATLTVAMAALLAYPSPIPKTAPLTSNSFLLLGPPRSSTSSNLAPINSPFVLLAKLR